MGLQGRLPTQVQDGTPKYLIPKARLIKARSGGSDAGAEARRAGWQYLVFQKDGDPPLAMMWQFPG